jgi:hypothetical protein
MTNPEFRVLGVFHPSEYKMETMEAEMRPLLPPCCAREAVSVRYPNGIDPNYNNMQWHQDGGGTEGTIRHMVVWASEDPTHIKDSSGAEFQAKPFEMVWFNNDLAYHKQPENTRPSDRWFISVRCSGVIVV